MTMDGRGRYMVRKFFSCLISALLVASLVPVRALGEDASLDQLATDTEVTVPADPTPPEGDDAPAQPDTQPAANQPAEQPAAEQPSEQPATDQPATDQPVASQPASEQPEASGQPAASPQGTDLAPASAANQPASADQPDQKPTAFSATATTAAGVRVSATAQPGVLPAGTTMQLSDVPATVATNAATQALGDLVIDAQGVDISFHNALGAEIEPTGYVQVSMSLPDALEGENHALVHVPDNGAAERVGGATATNASFAAAEFSLYVMAGTGTPQDPYVSLYREYTLGYGEAITIYSDEKNDDGTWIPGYAGNGPAWQATAVQGGTVDELATLERYRGTADVQPHLVVTARQRTGTIRVAFKYLHPQDKTHKTVTGEFVAIHYYLIHIVSKDATSHAVQFFNNDTSGASAINELAYTVGGSEQQTKAADSPGKFTLNAPVGAGVRSDGLVITMPNMPSSKTRPKNGTAGVDYEFIGWSTLASANPTTGGQGSIVYPFPDAHIYKPGDLFVVDRNVTFYAAWAVKNNLKATFHMRIDDHIPNEPQSHGNASYVQIGKDITYTLPSAYFVTDAVNGVDEGWDPAKRQKPWPAKVFSDLKAAGKLPDTITNVDEFKARYRVVWATVKKESEGWHVDGLLYDKLLYNLAYHGNGDLVVISSMPEGIKDIEANDTTKVDTRIPNRYDRVFTGWNTKPDGTGQRILPGTELVVSEHEALDTSTNTLHLYAQWEKSTAHTYTVNYYEAGTDIKLRDSITYGDQILGNKVSSKLESEKATSQIPDYIFSYAHPATDTEGLTIGPDNSQNVIDLYYTHRNQDILATHVDLHKTDASGNPLAGAVFELYDSDGASRATYTSDANGTVHIPIDEDPGPNAQLSYTVREKEAPMGFEPTANVYTIQVTRGERRTVTLKGSVVEVVYPLVAQVLVNGKQASGTITVVNKPTEHVRHDLVSFEVQKTLEGRVIQAGEFGFRLVDEDGVVVDTATNDQNGIVRFDSEVLTKEGTHTYVVEEIPSAETDIDNDEAIHAVTVTVDKNGKNTVLYQRNGVPVDALAFHNVVENAPTYEPLSFSVVANKVLKGRELKAGEFTFKLDNAEGEEQARAANDASGAITFGGLEVAHEGTYVYEISEVVGDDESVAYDTSMFTATVQVKANSEGKLAVTDVVYELEGEPTDSATFTNAARDESPKIHTITYDLNGGTYKGSAQAIKEKYVEGTSIRIHEAPVREGYTFQYWKGSSYQPGDTYKVTEDHAFVAQWKANATAAAKGKKVPLTADTSATGMLACACVGAMALLAARMRRRRA